MLTGDQLKPGTFYWVKRRGDYHKDEPVTIALVCGELPQCTLRVLDTNYTPLFREYDFLAEFDMDGAIENFLDDCVEASTEYDGDQLTV